MLVRRGAAAAGAKRSSALWRLRPDATEAVAARAAAAHAGFATPSAPASTLATPVGLAVSSHSRWGSVHASCTDAGCVSCRLQVRRFSSVARKEDHRHHHHEEEELLEAPVDPAAALEEQRLDALVAAEHEPTGGKVALDIFLEIQREDGRGLSTDIATAMISAMGAKKMVSECLEVLVYSREKGVRPRIHGYSAAIACCYNEEQYSHALRVFEVMRNDGYVPKTVTYSRALSAALKSDLHELVLEIFDDMLKNRVEMTIVIYNNILNSCARVGDAQSALGVLRAIRQRELDMTQSTYHSLAICAGKTGRWELALDVLSSMQEAGFQPTLTIYNSVFSACAKGKHWEDIVDVFNSMPDKLKTELRGLYLGAVLMGHAKSDSNEVQLRGLEIFNNCKARGDDLNQFAHNAALTALLATNQLDDVHKFATEMKRRGVKWNTVTYQTVILAYIRGGAVDTAMQMLQANAKRMGKSTGCYRELIRFYAEKRKNPREACRLTMQMMQNNARLSRLDWHNALEVALQLPERAPYWNFRKWMKVRAAGIIDEVPEHLMLPENGDSRAHAHGQPRKAPRKPGQPEPKFL